MLYTFGLVLSLSLASLQCDLVYGDEAGSAHYIQKNGKKGLDSAEKLSALRAQMKLEKYDAYIITTADEHQSEYTSEADKRRQYITGFTGSAGTAVVTSDDARLWTDSRYYIQAEEELDQNWTLMGESSVSIELWLNANLKSGNIVGADARLISITQWERWQSSLANRVVTLVSSTDNLVDRIWDKDGRPEPSNATIAVQLLKYAGKSWESKIQDIREILSRDYQVDALVVTSLTEVAWLFNLRGGDVPYVPVFKAFATITMKNVKLYVDQNKLSKEVMAHLNSSETIEVKIVDYEKVYTELADDMKGLSVLITNSASQALRKELPEKKLVVLARTPILDAMVVKNKQERDGMRSAMLKDSVALTEFFAKLEIDVSRGVPLTEVSLTKELQLHRKNQPDYKDESFAAMSAMGSHSALPHYSPTPKTDRPVDNTNMYLLDSGGQYLDGTTDVTRTMHFGSPTDFQKEAYTRVLMGHISLASLVFPEGITDTHVDVLNRLALYNVGLDYGHGSGHGVGAYLSVHEYPPLIRLPRSKGEEGYPFKPGMFFSIEPGFYQKNDFGVRLETIFTVVEAETENKFENKTFYKFQPVVFVPFEKKLINTKLLSQEQIAWLDIYHIQCWNKLKGRTSETAQKWLKERTAPVRDWTNTATPPASPFLALIFIGAFATILKTH